MIFVGREAEIAEAVESVGRGNSVLLKGRPGIGKRSLLKRIRERIAADRLCLAPDMTTARAMANSLAEQTHEQIGLIVPERLIPGRWRAQAHRDGRVGWSRIQRTISREPVGQVVALVIESIADRDAVVCVDTLEVPPTLAAALHELAEVAKLVACMESDNRRARIMRLLWRFQTTIDVPPLRPAETREIVEHHIQQERIEFQSDRVRAMFIRAVQQDSGGVPAAILGMLAAAGNDGIVSRSAVRSYRHEAAAVYWDMTPMLLITAAGILALRYIGRGAGIQELMVLAGVGSSLFWILVYFTRRMSR